jgi:predicted  nucleic acid-binding Zn-ribbon protein
MTVTADLYALQQIDTALDAAERELEQIRGRFGDSPAVAEARTAVAVLEARRHAAEFRTRELEAAVAGLRAKMVPVERRLYDGTVGNPKELQSLQDELEMLRRQQRTLEDQQLEAMEELEQTAADLAAARTAVAAAEAAWVADQGGLRERQAALEGELKRLRAQRQARAARIDAGPLALYERLRRARWGLAVAKIERGTCLGCRIALPTTLQQRARSGLQVVQCTSCERILYAG